MRAGSLQRRMLLLSAAATLSVTLLFGWAVAGVLQRLVTQGLDNRLDAELSLLAASVGEDGRVDRSRLRQDRGGLIAAPGWRWRIDGPDGVLGSAAALDVDPPPPPRPPPDGTPPGAPPGTPPGTSAGPLDTAGARPVDGIGAGGVPVHARTLILPSRRGPVRLLAEAPRAVLRQPIRAALLPLLSLLLVLLVLLTAASLLQLRIGLAPVRRLRDQVELIRTGRRERVDENQPAELRPLAVELNALAADNKAALQAARRSSANLAHALKTPVAVLALALRDQPEHAAQLARIEATIRHHLRRARLALVDRRSETALGPAVAGVLRAIRHLHADRGLRIEATGVDGLLVTMDATDLDEVLGNLLDNAAGHAAGQVWLDAERDPQDARKIRIRVADDGAGLSAEQRAVVLTPESRLDQRGPGNGFGLSIAGELLALHGGSLALGERDGGGLLVELVLPGRADG